MTLPVRLLDCRRIQRLALSLPATAREQGRSRFAVRIVDMSTHGCRIEVPIGLVADANLWLSVAGLAAIESRIVWHKGNFAGLEFNPPMSEAVLDGVLEAHTTVTASAALELRGLASRIRRLWLQSTDCRADLQRFSRDCSVQALVHALKLAEQSPARFGRPQLDSSMIRRSELGQRTEPGFSFPFSASHMCSAMLVDER